MGQRDVEQPVALDAGPHDGGEGFHRAEEGADGEQTDEQDDPRPERRQELIEPGAAEGLLGEGRDAVSPGAWEASRVAARDRGEVDPAVEVLAGDAPLLHPVAELLAGDAGERSDLAGAPKARGLPDEEDLRQRRIGLGIARDGDRFGGIQEAGLMAAAAGADARIELDEP